MQELLPLITGIAGTVFGFFVKYLLEPNQTKKKEQDSRKREVYENLINSMSIFISGRNQASDKQDLFLESYSRLWLWAPDHVIEKINIHLEDQIDMANNKRKNAEIKDDDAKKSYTRAVIEMRKDLGYKSKHLTDSDFKFIAIISDQYSNQKNLVD